MCENGPGTGHFDEGLSPLQIVGKIEPQVSIQVKH